MKKKIIIGAFIHAIIIGGALALTVFQSRKNGGLQYKKEVVQKGDIEVLRYK